MRASEVTLMAVTISDGHQRPAWLEKMPLHGILVGQSYGNMGRSAFRGYENAPVPWLLLQPTGRRT